MIHAKDGWQGLGSTFREYPSQKARPQSQRSYQRPASSSRLTASGGRALPEAAAAQSIEASAGLDYAAAPDTLQPGAAEIGFDSSELSDRGDAV